MAYQIIVLDLDGTLTNSQKEITPKTKEALMRIQKEGKTVVLASGRPTPGVLPLAEELELEKYGGYILLTAQRSLTAGQKKSFIIRPFRVSM